MLDSRFSKRFRESVDPIWWLVIAIVAWSEHKPTSTRQFSTSVTDRDWQSVAHDLEKLFSRADQHLGDREEWLLSKYALVVWTDELLTRCHWPGRDRWADGSLEQQIYGHREPGWRFLERTREAWDFPLTEPRETCFLCVCLGLQSLFEVQRDELTARGLPATAADWVRDVSARGIAGKHVPPIIRYHTASQSHPTLGRQELVRTLVWTALTSVTLLLLTSFLLLRGPLVAD